MALLKKAKKTAGIKAPFPQTVAPMLATLVAAPVSDPEYIHEIKFDGYRIIATVQKKRARLYSRSALDYTKNYPAIVQALQAIRHDMVLDGEVCALNADGIPDFDALQANLPGTQIVYYVFDLLWFDGLSLMHLPLLDRKRILAGRIPFNDRIRYSDHFEDGPALYRQMQQMGTEGIVSKRKDSVYRPGERGSDWLKVPVKLRQEFVIGGWAESEKARAFRSLLFGAYNSKKQLEWVGRSGGGYKQKDMPAILKKLKSLEIKKSPFINPVLDTKGAVIHWVKPQLVANFAFSGFTHSGRIRKPATFLGFRDDKKPITVVRELPSDIQKGSVAVEKRSKKGINATTEKQPVKKKMPPATAESNWPKIEKQPITSRQTFYLKHCEIELYNVEREVWDGITKAALIQYYHSVSSYILPHIKDRPQSLHIKPIRAGAPGFYIKDMEERQPSCAGIFTVSRKHKKGGKRNQIDYLVCNNEETLLWMINLGCIDVNPWTARTQNHLQPDYIVIDLDPSDDDFNKAIDAARAAKEWFDQKKLQAFVKTSGKTGLHLYLPCAGFTFAQARNIAENICEAIHALIPGITTTEVSKSLRGNKLYLDPNQNDEADTVAAPYSARPFHIPTVSMPLQWKEVKKGLHPHDFTIHTAWKRVKNQRDHFYGVLEKTFHASNNKVLKQLLQ